MYGARALKADLKASQTSAAKAEAEHAASLERTREVAVTSRSNHATSPWRRDEEDRPRASDLQRALDNSLGHSAVSDLLARAEQVLEPRVKNAQRQDSVGVHHHHHQSAELEYRENVRESTARRTEHEEQEEASVGVGSPMVMTQRSDDEAYEDENSEDEVCRVLLKLSSDLTSSAAFPRQEDFSQAVLDDLAYALQANTHRFIVAPEQVICPSPHKIWHTLTTNLTLSQLLHTLTAMVHSHSYCTLSQLRHTLSMQTACPHTHPNSHQLTVHTCTKNAGRRIRHG
jgi:hypothetical protein